GTVLFTLLVLYQRAERRSKLAVRIAGVAAVGLALAAVAGGPELWEALGDTDMSAKARAFRWSLALIRDFPIFGAGRGAFETAFQPYRQPLVRDWVQVYAHVENFPLEWAADWGIPVSLLALAGWAALARRPLRRALQDPVAAGLVSGLGAL